MASQAKTIADLQQRVAELEHTTEMFKQFMNYATYQATFQATYQDKVNQGFFQALQMGKGKEKEKGKGKKRRRSVPEDCGSSC
jgi:hypothetical protein